jgi:hypothetical protein
MKKRNSIDKFKGYPHYPAKDDITRPGNNNGKEPFEKPDEPPHRFVNDTMDERDEVAIVPGTEADVSAEDLRMLEAADQNMDTMDSSNLLHSSLDSVDDDGEPLNEDSLSMDMSGEDLDVPGSSDDDADELIGEEDEENNYYSLGGDLHENQEEYKGE